jgi:hypothetical protein
MIVQGGMLAKWLVHYDPIHRGYTARGIANGVCATSGWSFPRLAGGYNLYRGTPTPQDIDLLRPVGAAGTSAERISTFSWCPHAAGVEYFHVVRAVGGGGVEGPMSVPPVSVAFDAGGVCLGGRPNAPGDIDVRPTAGGHFRLSWSYSSLGEEVSPSLFRVYSDGGDGEIDYGAAVAEVPYRAGRLRHCYEAGPFVHGARRGWAVRAISASGRDDGNTVAVAAVADADGPEPSPHVVCELLDAAGGDSGLVSGGGQVR